MNKIILMGRLTKDVEMRTSKTDSFVAKYTLAVNRRFVAPGEERQADFINIVAFGKTAEFCGKFFKKGQQVGIIGRLQCRSWEDDKGQKRYATEVLAEEAYFADSNKNQEENTYKTAGNADVEETTSDDDLPF